MKLPGAKYQDAGWEHVKKMLGDASLVVWRMAEFEAIADATRNEELFRLYVDCLLSELMARIHRGEGARAGNYHGEGVADLAVDLVLFVNHSRPQALDRRLEIIRKRAQKDGAYWLKKPGDLRKILQDMYAEERYFADVDPFVAATGTRITANGIARYAAIDGLYTQVSRIFGQWETQKDKVEAILDRVIPDGVAPLEIRRIGRYNDCKGQWILNWDREQGRWKPSRSPGPIHQGKSFQGLRFKPARIDEILAELQDFEEIATPITGGDDADERFGSLLQRIGRNVDEGDTTPEVAPAQDAEAQGPDEGDEAADPAGADDPMTGWEAGLDDGLIPEDGSDTGADASAEKDHLAAPESGQPDSVSASPGKEDHEEDDEEDAEEAADPRMEATMLCLKRHEEPLQIAIWQEFLPDTGLPDKYLDPKTGLPPTQAELARRLGVSPPTWRKRVSRAVDQFLVCLKTAVKDFAADRRGAKK